MSISTRGLKRLPDLSESLARITEPIVAELVAMYCLPNGCIHPWFKRRLEAQPAEVQKEVRRWIGDLSLDQRRDQLRKQRVQEGRTSALTEDEWDRLADLVIKSQLKHPSKSVTVLANRAMAQLPKNRQVRLSAKNIKPLTARLQARLDALLAAEKRLGEVEAQLQAIQAAPTKQEILEGLSDAEVIRYFGDRIFQLLTPTQILSNLDDETITNHLTSPVLIGRAVQRGLEAFSDVATSIQETIDALQTKIAQLSAYQANGNGSPPSRAATPASPPATRLPRVALLGPLSGQAQTIAHKLEGRGRFETVDKNQLESSRSMPTGCDIVVVWTDFVPPATLPLICDRNPGAKLIRHHGGVTGLIRKLNLHLPLVEGRKPR